MKTNVQIKNEPIEIPNSSTKTVNELLHLYDYNQITNSPKDSFVNQEKDLVLTCAWCQKLVNQSFTLYTDNSDSKRLCSEVCFNRYRRASFKKIQSTNCAILEKKTINKIKHNYHQDTNRRKFLSPYRRSTQRKSKPDELSRNVSSSSTEKISSDLPNCSPSLDINHLFRQLPLALPMRTTSSEQLPSTLFPTLTKGLLSNYTCILPTFIPLPIPIPLSFPVHSPCVKCSIDVISQGCQTEMQNIIDSFPNHQKPTRRMSI